MDGRSEEERLKSAKCDVEEGEPEVIGNREHDRFCQDGSERRNGFVGVVWMRLSSILDRLMPLHGLNRGGDQMTSPSLVRAQLPLSRTAM